MLKERFTSGPILVHPDPTLPFVMVDTSDTGVVLSQRNEDNKKTAPMCLSRVFINFYYLPSKQEHKWNNLVTKSVKSTTTKNHETG
jgi:hypothetical protein